MKGDPDEDKEHCSGHWPKRVVVSHVLEGEVGFVGLLQPGHQDSARDDVVVRRLSGADVEVQLGIMVSEHVRDKGEDGRERDADNGDALCDDLVVQMHHVLPLKDVEVLDRLPQGDLGQVEEEEKAADVEVPVAKFRRVWSRENHVQEGNS